MKNYFSAVILLGGLLFCTPSSWGLLHQSNFIQLGTFTTPNTYWTGCSDYGTSGNCAEQFAFGGSAIGYNPAHNSLFINGFSGRGGYIAEITIPTTLYVGAVSDLTSTTGINQPQFISSLLQSPTAPYFFDVSGGNFTHVGATGESLAANCSLGWGVGGIYSDGSSIIMSSFCKYLGKDSFLPLYKYSPASNISTGVFFGNFGFNITNNPTDATGDLQSGALGVVPSQYQSQLGGKMVVGALPAEMSIIGRTSNGPGAVVFNLEDAIENSVSQTNNGIWLLGYPSSHQTLGQWNVVSNQFTSVADSMASIFIPSGGDSLIVVGTHGHASPGIDCPGLPTENATCYGYATNQCGEVCGGGGVPTCSNGYGGCSTGYHKCGSDCIAMNESCCYDPAHLNTGHSNLAWPYTSYVWMYDIGDSSGNNNSGNSIPSASSSHPEKNNLTAVKLGQINPWDLYPYAVFNLPDTKFNGNNRGTTGGTYDSANSILYLVYTSGQPYPQALPIIEAYHITIGDAPGGLVQFYKDASGNFLRIQ